MADLIDPPEHLKITYLSGAFDKTSPSEPTSWDDVVAKFRENHKSHQNFVKLEHPAFSPSSRPADSRLLAQNVTSVHWAVWDLDDCTPDALADVRGFLADNGVSHITHTTGSHGKGGPGVGRWRIICPLSAPVPAGLWKTVWSGINRASGGHNDPACKDPSRLYFLPGWAAGAPDPGDRFLLVTGGRALDPKPFLQKAAPLDLAQITADPVGALELQGVCNKLTAKRDPTHQQVGQRLRVALAGQNYGDPGQEPSFDLWRFRFAAAIMDSLPHGDIHQIAEAFKPAHIAIDADTIEVERRQEEMLAKLARFQFQTLKMPVELASGEFTGDVVEGDSDLELARWVVGSWGSVVHSRGVFWRYDRDRGVWSARPEDAVWKSLEALEGALVTSKKNLFRLSERQGSSVYKASRLHTLDEKFFDSDTPGICFKNGFVSLEPDAPIELRPHSPGNRAIFAVDEAWTPGAPCPAWLQVLDNVFRDDDDKASKIAMLQEFVGAALGGVAPQYGKALILLGGGSNGKSTLLQVIAALFPDDAITAQTPHDWSSASASYNLVALTKSAVNLVPEVGAKSVANPELVKSIVVGDPILARPIREMPFTFKPKTAHFFAMNELFASSDNTRGFLRRWIVLKFNRNFENQDGGSDRTVDSVVREVLVQKAGIYAWAFEGLQRLITQGHYTPVTSSVNELGIWHEDNDPVTEWLKGNWEAFDAGEDPTAHGFVAKNKLPTALALHADLVAWAADNQVPEQAIPRRRKLSRWLTSRCKVYTPGGTNHFGLRRAALGSET